MHITEVLVALSKKRQVDYSTPLADADCDQVVTFNTPTVTTHDATQISDRTKFGKGHDFTTAVQLESFKTQRVFNFDADSLNLPWALGIMLGDVTTTNIDVGASYQHVFKFSDRPSVGGQNPRTSIIEKIGNWETRKVPSLTGSSLRLVGELEKRITSELTLQGSGRIITEGVIAPSFSALVPTRIFINQMNLFELGEFAGSLSDQGADFHGWELNINNALQVDLSYYPGSGFQDQGLGAKATGTWTGTATPANNDTINLGATTYTWVTSLGAANTVLIGGNLATALTNLAAAINGSAGAGTIYGTGTVANTSASASASGNTLIATALTAGTAGNTIATTDTSAAGNWGAATLLGGVAPGVVDRESGAVSGRMEYGMRTVDLTMRIRVRAGSPVHTQLIKGTPMKAKLTCTGNRITGTTTPYTFILDFKKFSYRTMAVETVGDGILLFTLASEVFYTQADQGPFLATVITNIDEILGT